MRQKGLLSNHRETAAMSSVDALYRHARSKVALPNLRATLITREFDTVSLQLLHERKIPLSFL
jgi:hypothetical protein